MKLDEFLTARDIPFERMLHPPAATANRVAECLHIPGDEVAKSVLLRSTRGYLLAVLPATFKVDLDRMRRELGEDQMEMACEQEVEQIFTDCERGAASPFGSMYRIRTVVDEHLAADEKIVFDAQSHEEAIRMAFRDYATVEHPRIGHFARH
jgi:Ala-tRNA(Pro) deacylase